MCQYGERVVGRLLEWHVSLIQEADRCRTMVETEVANWRRWRAKQLNNVV
jgi:hypothetical protein